MSLRYTLYTWRLQGETFQFPFRSTCYNWVTSGYIDTDQLVDIDCFTLLHAVYVSFTVRRLYIGHRVFQDWARRQFQLEEIRDFQMEISEESKVM